MAQIELDIGERRVAGVRATPRGLPYRWQLWLLLVPYLAGLTLLVVIPALVGLPLAFTEFNALQPPALNGLDNLVEMSGDPIFWKSVFNSSVYIALAVPLRLLGALAMALLLLRAMRGIGALRGAIYLPTVVPDVAWAIPSIWLLNPAFGPVNQLLALFGLPGPAWMVQEWGLATRSS